MYSNTSRFVQIAVGVNNDIHALDEEGNIWVLQWVWKEEFREQREEWLPVPMTRGERAH